MGIYLVSITIVIFLTILLPMDPFGLNVERSTMNGQLSNLVGILRTIVQFSHVDSLYCGIKVSHYLAIVFGSYLTLIEVLDG